jgi:hypothetical protein
MNWLLFLLHVFHGALLRCWAPIGGAFRSLETYYFLRVRPLWAPAAARRLRRRRIAHLRALIQSPPHFWNEASIARAREALASLERSEEVYRK